MRARILDIALPAVLLLTVYAGSVKASPQVTRLLGSFDLTFLGAAIVVLVVAHNAVSGRLPSRGLSAFLILTLAFLPGAILSPLNSSYAAEKIFRLFALGLVCSLLGATVILASQRRRRGLMFALVGWGVLVSALYFFAPTTNADLTGRVALDGSNTIAIARATGSGLVALTVLSMAREVRLIVAVPIASVFLYLMVGSGSRGPLIAAIVAIVVFLVAYRGRRKWIGLPVVTVVVATGLWWAFQSADALARNRFLLLGKSDRGQSVRYREGYLAQSLDVAGDHPLGVGWGGLEQYLGVRYPHNMVMEVMAEGGWIALVIFGGLVLFALASVLRRRADAIAAGLLAMLAYSLFNAAVSGDLNDNRLVFVVLGACIVYPAVAVRPKSMCGSTAARR